MLKTIFSRMKWLARGLLWMAKGTSILVGLTVMVALTAGVVSEATAANGGNFILGSLNNAATAITKLTGNVAGPAMQVVNPNTGAAATALNLSVDPGNPPLTVNATAGKATNLNADKVDSKNSTDFVRYGSVYEVVSRAEGSSPGDINVGFADCDEGDVALSGDYQIDQFSAADKDRVLSTNVHQDPATPAAAKPGYTVTWYDDPATTSISDIVMTVNCADLGTPHQ